MFQTTDIPHEGGLSIEIPHKRGMSTDVSIKGLYPIDSESVTKECIVVSVPQMRTDWDAPSDQSESQCDSPARYRASNCHGNQYQKVGSDWGAMAAGQIDRYSDQHTRGSYSPYSNSSSHYRSTHHTRNIGTQMSPKHKCCHHVDPVEEKYVTFIIVFIFFIFLFVYLSCIWPALHVNILIVCVSLVGW